MISKEGFIFETNIRFLHSISFYLHLLSSIFLTYFWPQSDSHSCPTSTSILSSSQYLKDAVLSSRHRNRGKKSIVYRRTKPVARSQCFFFFEIETGFRFMYCCSICGGVRQVCVAHSYAEVETIYYDLVVVHTEDRTKSGGRSACFSSPYSCFFHKSFLLFPLCRNDIIVIRRLHRQTGSTWTWIALNSICT